MLSSYEPEVEEPILSAELLEELGGDSTADVILTGKKKKRTHNPDEVTEEVKTLAKQLSKKAQKRVAQITQRKEKEAKRADFFSTIHEHEISEEHRQLLTSSRGINQTLTMKQLLSNIFKKQAAGLKLTPEESQLLYNQPIENVDTMVLPVTLAAPVVDSTLANAQASASSGDVFLSFDDIIPLNCGVDAGSAHSRPKKAKRKKNRDTGGEEAASETKSDAKSEVKVPKPHISVPAATGAVPAVVASTSKATATEIPAAGSVGLNLLAQLKQLKAGSVPMVKKAQTGSTSIANDVEITGADNSVAYEVKETACPVSSQGEVVRSVTTTGASTAGASTTDANSIVAGSGNKGKTAFTSAAASAGTSASSNSSDTRAATAVVVNRSAEVQAARMELPVCHMEQEIVEAVNNAANDAIILCGETGSGKSTQVPQFLYEAGYGIGGMIGITQPRRVAVTSTAQRVSFEMTSGIVAAVNDSVNTSDSASAGKKGGKKGAGAQKGADTNLDGNNSKDNGNKRNGQLVGYQIRFDSSTVGPDTRIKFMTDGILLKEVAQDLLLRKYRVVILDEAHERNMNTDVLLGMLSKVLPLRRAQAAVEQQKYDSLPAAEREHYALPLQPLKLIIMSATMRVNDFQNPRLFPTALPPIIKVEARQYPVTTHFAKRTETVNYLKETHKKVCQIHRKLPDGGVLVFLTGKQEILYMCHKLAKSLNKRSRGAAVVADPADAAETQAEQVDVSGLGASAEELMEIEEDTHLQNTHSTGTLKQGTRHGKDKKHRSNHSNKKDCAEDGDQGPSMRELLMQDEISSDSDSDGAGSDINSDTDENSDIDSDTASGRITSSSAVAKKAAVGTADSKSVGAAVLTPEEALYVLDGDENHTKHSNTGTTSKTSVQSKVQSAKQGLVTGDAVRDQLLREALGVDPACISDANLLGQSDLSPDTGTTAITGATAAATSTAASVPATEAEEAAPLRAWILPLYALMPAALQNRVFLPPPPGHRLIVVATNVAETSITIPGIRYVVDSGRQKERVLSNATPQSEQEDQQQTAGSKRAFTGTAVVPNDVLTAAQGASSGAGVAKYEVKWVSQAAAEQRQGRAGRTGPGHCYRLYSANFYHQYLQPYQPPEITVTPLEELILQMKALGIDHVDRFPFPTPPPPHSVRNALSLLTNLGAIAAAGTVAVGNEGAGASKKGSKSTCDLTAEIAMATMNVMKHNTPLHQKQLQQLQELHKQQQQARELCPLTALGRVLSRFPINPRFAKMLVMAYRATGLPINNVGAASGSTVDLTGKSKDKFALLAHALTLVATLAERSVFESTNTGGKGKKLKSEGVGQEGAGDSDSCSSEDECAAEEADRNTHFLFHHEDGDALARLRATGAYVHAVTSFLRSAAAETQSRTPNKAAQRGAEVTLGKREVLGANESSLVKSLCSTHHLHAPTLQRIIELRDQLQDISATVLLPAHAKRPTPTATAASNSTVAVDSDRAVAKQLLAVPAAPPTSAQELALRQLILSGFCDSIARRAPLGVVKTGPRRRRLTAYFSSHPALLDVPLYLHPVSNLYRKDPTATLPEFVTYGALVHNQRGDCVYMTTVSTIAAPWIASVAADCPLLKWSSPLASPAPYYDHSSDTVMCCVIPRYGVHNWELPAMRRPLLDCTAAEQTGTVGTPLGFRKQDEVYRWFAKLLLEGSIFASPTTSASSSSGATTSKLSAQVSANAVREIRAALCKSRLTDASAVVVTQMKPIPKVSNLLRKLVNREVNSATTLLHTLCSEPTYLCEEVQEFLNVEHRKAFRAAWAKMAASAAETAARK